MISNLSEDQKYSLLDVLMPDDLTQNQEHENKTETEKSL